MESKLPWIYMNDIESVWKEYIAIYEREDSTVSLAEIGT